MARGALRGAMTAWLGLIVLQTVTTTGAGRVSGLIGSVDDLVKRAFDPSVPAIPDRSAGAAATGAAAATTPAQRQAANTALQSSGLYSPPVTTLPVPGHPVPN